MLADPIGVDPTIAHLGLLLANDHGVGSKYSKVVFRKFWRNELDLACEEAIVSVLQGVGIEDTDSLNELKPRLSEIYEELLSQEVFSVPTFLVKGERFIGRQHSSMIRRLFDL